MKCENHLRCVIKCALDLNCFDMDVYSELLKKGQATVDELAETFKKDKSTVYKSLQNLLEKGIVTREYRILRSGGYKYIYKPAPFEKFKETVSRSINQWVKTLEAFLSSLEGYTENKIVQTIETGR